MCAICRPWACWRAGDLLVVNETKVLPARFEAVREKTGGKAEGLFLAELASSRWLFMMQTRGSPALGETIRLDDRAALILTEKGDDGQWTAPLESDSPTLAVLERVGATPITLHPQGPQARWQVGRPARRPGALQHCLRPYLPARWQPPPPAFTSRRNF